MRGSLPNSLQGYRHPTAVSTRPRASTRRIALALGLAVAPTLFAASASAHHILGIPHYKYGADYPQIPYVEVLAQVDQTDLHFTYFPGSPKPGERVRFKLYAVDRLTKKPFVEPLHVEIVRRRALAGDESVGEAFDIRPGVGPEANDFKFFRVFDDADAFDIVVHFPNGAQLEEIRFPFEIGTTDARPLFGGALAILSLTVVSVSVLKRRDRKSVV